MVVVGARVVGARVVVVGARVVGARVVAVGTHVDPDFVNPELQFHEQLALFPLVPALV